MIPYAPQILIGLGLIGPGSLAEPIQAEPLTLRDCGLALTQRAGLSPMDGAKVLDALDTHSVVNTPEFMRYLYALAYVESRFRADRRSGAGAVGMLQVTPQAAEHIHMLRRLVGLRPVKVTTKMLPQTQYNVNIGSAYLWLAYEEAGSDWVGALTMYNSGYRGLTKLQRGDNVPAETSQYVLQVLHLSHTCGVN